MPGAQGALSGDDWREQLGLSQAEWRRMHRSSPFNVQQDTYDIATGRTLMRGSPDYAAATSNSPPWEAMCQDAWATFYKAEPALRPAAKVDEKHAGNRPVLERLMADPTTAQTRAATMLDETAAALAALAAMPELRKEVEREQAEAERRQQQAANNAAMGLPAPAGAAGNPDPAAVRRAVRKAAQAAQKATEQYAQVLAGWGLTPADLKLADPGERLRAVARLALDPQFRRMADLVGRMRNLARARQRQRLQHQADELHGIETGRDLGRLLPSELGALNHPLLKLDLYRRITEGQALQYRLESRARQGRGPIVVLLDASGSMSETDGPDGSSRMDRAKAIALALVDTAHRQRRAAAVAIFNGGIAWSDYFSPRKPLDVTALVQLASVAPGGGTNYDVALLHGLGHVNVSEFRAADLVLVSDGACHANEETRTAVQDARQAKGLRVFSILTGGTRVASVSEWSDRVWCVPSLGDDVAGQLFEEVVAEA